MEDTRTVTTLKFEEEDLRRIKLIREHLGVGKLPMRAAVAWALKVAEEKIGHSSALMGQQSLKA